MEFQESQNPVPLFRDGMIAACRDFVCVVQVLVDDLVCQLLKLFKKWLECHLCCPTGAGFTKQVAAANIKPVSDALGRGACGNTQTGAAFDALDFILENLPEALNEANDFIEIVLNAVKKSKVNVKGGHTHVWCGLSSIHAPITSCVDEVPPFINDKILQELVNCI